jgi:hypothetical protein
MSNSLINEKRLSEFTEGELSATVCEYCSEKNLGEYACATCIKDNEPICVDCCGCYDEERGLNNE